MPQNNKIKGKGLKRQSFSFYFNVNLPASQLAGLIAVEFLIILRGGEDKSEEVRKTIEEELKGGDENDYC